MNTIYRWSARVCRTRRNPIQHPHSVSLSRGRSDSHNPTHCISARMTAIARPRETNGYNPEFLSARKTTFHSSLLTRLRQTADTRRLPPGRRRRSDTPFLGCCYSESARHPDHERIYPCTVTFLRLRARATLRRLCHLAPNKASVVDTRQTSLPLGQPCCITSQSQTPVSRAS